MITTHHDPDTVESGDLLQVAVGDSGQHQGIRPLRIEPMLYDRIAVGQILSWKISVSRLPLGNREPELRQVLVIERRGSALEESSCRSGLRKRDHVPETT